MWRRISAAGARRLISARRGIRATPRASAFVSASRKRSAGSEADLDVRYGSRDGTACAEFSWEGFDDGSPASGRGWAALGTAGRLVGHIFIDKGDDSGFVAERE